MNDKAKNPSTDADSALTSSTGPTSGRGRSRIYESNSEKVEAFRQRHKEGGFLRKEVLVQADVADRITELAKQLGTSTMNVSSGLLELGLKTYETQHLGVTSSPRVPVELNTAFSESAKRSVSSALGTTAPAGLVAQSSRAFAGSTFASAMPADAAFSLAEPQSAISAGNQEDNPSSVTKPLAAEPADPIQSFFASRKRVLK